MGKADRMLSEKLIGEVQKRPILYDTTNPEYRNRGKVEREWMNVAQVMEIPADIAKKKWQNLRGSYSKSLAATNQSSGPEIKKTNTFYLHDQLSFLSGHMIHGSSKDSVGNGGPATEEHGESEEEVLEKLEIRLFPLKSGLSQTQGTTSTSSMAPAANRCAAPAFSKPKPKKRKREPTESAASDLDKEILKYIKSRADRRPDVVMEYFKGLAPQVRELSKVRQRKLFHIVSSSLFQLLNEQEEEAEQIKSETFV